MIETTEVPNTYDGTPTGFRNFYSEWRKTAPANDSDIIPDKPRIPLTPRHAGMCADLKSILAWRDTKESVDPLQTNYLQAGIDDEIVSDDGILSFPERDVECESEVRPTIKEITDAVSGVAFRESYDTVFCWCKGARFTYWRARRIPDLDAPANSELVSYRKGGKSLQRPRIGYGDVYASTVLRRLGPKGKLIGLSMQPVIRLGELEFSTAESHEIYPRGSMLKWNPGSYGEPVDEPGTPNGSSERFFPPPEIQRLNPLERLIAMEDRIAANENLSTDHVNALDAAVVAQNFSAVGEAFGFSGKTAERQGKRLVHKAAKEFSKVLERLAA